MNDGTYVIAEAGVNHNGDLQLARELVRTAAKAGADAVKFQTFDTPSLVQPSAPKAPYQERTTESSESQFEMLKRLELSRDAHFELEALAAAEGLDFLSTPFDMPSLHFLVGDMGLTQVKLPSSDLTNLPLLVEAGRSGASLILSTGMADIGEIEQALKAIAYGLSTPSGVPSPEAIDAAYADGDVRGRLAQKVVLLQCTSNYPARVQDANLRVIPALSQAFGLPVGYSDHTEGITSAIAAVALGAVVIEKHLTLDKTLPGPDHAASSDPTEFAALVHAVRAVEEALGSPVKTPSGDELLNRRAMRKGLYAARPIPAGTYLEEDDLVVLRPETPDNATAFYRMVGRRTVTALCQGDAIVSGVSSSSG